MTGPVKFRKRLLIPELDMYLVESLPGFTCRRCARCCTGKLIPLYQSDIDRIKPYVEEKFCQNTSLLEREVSGDTYKMMLKEGRCVFLDGVSCRIYDVRPNTCRRHPFLVTDSHFLVSSTCPGICWLSEKNSEEYHMLSKEISKTIDSFLEKHLLSR